MRVSVRTRLAAIGLASASSISCLLIPLNSANAAEAHSSKHAHVLSAKDATAARSFGVPEEVIKAGLTDPEVAAGIPVTESLSTVQVSPADGGGTSSGLISTMSAGTGSCDNGKLYTNQVSQRVNDNAGLKLYTVYMLERWCGGAGAKKIFSDWTQQWVELGNVASIGIHPGTSAVMDNEWLPVVSGYPQSGHATIRYMPIQTCALKSAICWTDTMGQGETVYYDGTYFPSSWWV